MYFPPGFHRTFQVDEDEALFLYLNQLLVPRVCGALHRDLASVLGLARQTIQVIVHSDNLLANLNTILHKVTLPQGNITVVILHGVVSA